MKKLLSTLALATLFVGCSSTQGTTNPFVEKGDVAIKSTDKKDS